MADVSNKALIFNSVPTGEPTTQNLVLRSGTIAPVAPAGGLFVKILYVSFDPYLRGRMRPAAVKSYNQAFELGKPMSNFGIARVVVSDSPLYKQGDLVRSPLTQFAEYQAVTQPQLAYYEKIDNKDNFPLTYYIGVLGMPGATAYYSFYNIGGPFKKGETILVTAASGAVGQLVAQLARLEGLRVVGCVGSDAKVKYLIDELKFDDAWNYNAEKDPYAAMKKHIPEGIDIYFDNVGGEITDAAFASANNFARFIACGSISQYNVLPGQGYGMKNTGQIVAKRIKWQGFIIVDHMSDKLLMQEFNDKVSSLLRTGKFIFKEDVTVGIDNVFAGFMSLFKGLNSGKASIKIADE
ncbi:uncharacterized protein V1518DRAFT_410381 [Limtongia smithiae]|uniref:uncharacterized protein n=1 Tax=Limtongia smithiae TaxID=1125753 RepID=UPI0034CFC011